jgi:hypothetical protein
MRILRCESVPFRLGSRATAQRPFRHDDRNYGQDRSALVSLPVRNAFYFGVTGASTGAVAGSIVPIRSL